MKILHIITGLENGGAEAVLYRLASGDSSDNHHEVISFMDQGFYGEYLEDAGIKVHTLNMSRGKLTVKPLIILYSLIRSINPDVIQTWMYHANLTGGFMAFLAGKKNIVWSIHHSNLDPNTTSRGTLLVNRICSFISGVVPDKIICCSEQAAQVHVNVGYPLNKIVVVHNGIDDEKFIPNSEQRDKFHSEWNVRNDQVVLGMVARWDLNKDHKNLILALSNIKKNTSLYWKCVLVGQGINNSNMILMNLLKKYDVSENVILLGVRDDVPAILSALDLHILSSSGEAFGNATIEAMSCGIPSIVTSVGAGQLIVGETGWVVPPSNPRVLSETIVQAITLMKDPKSWTTRKLQCRERIIEKFTVEQMIDSYKRVWASL